MTTDNTQLTPAENRRKAGEALNRATGANPASPLYQNLALTAIAHILLEVGSYLDVLTARLEPPKIPGLPEGYTLETIQAEKNNRLWGYVVTCPDSRVVRSRFQWGYSETALTEGIRRAVIDQAALNGNGSEPG